MQMTELWVKIECIRRHQISLKDRPVWKEWVCKTADLPPTQWADTRICCLSALLPVSGRSLTQPNTLGIGDIIACIPSLMLRSCARTVSAQNAKRDGSQTKFRLWQTLWALRKEVQIQKLFNVRPPCFRKCHQGEWVRK